MLNKGSIIIFPTDTVYGIGCLFDDKEAQEKIYEIKKRPKNKRLSVLCSSIEDIEKIAYLDDRAKLLIAKYMPGGLTIILKTKEEYLSSYIYETIGVRIPNHQKTLELLKETGPLANTSVNISGEEPLNDYEVIKERFGKMVDEIFPNFEKPLGLPSTVIDLTSDDVKLIRQGAISFQDIIKTLEEKGNLEK